MTPLREELIRELVLRGMSPRTREAYVAAVYGLAKHYRRSPDKVSDAEIKEYLLHLHGKDRSASTINQVTSGLKFFYRYVVNRPIEQIDRALPRVKKPIRRPQVFSAQEIERLLTVEGLNPKHRVFLMTVYAGGLRVSEACHLKVEHILSDRMQLRIVEGKGKRDRYTSFVSETSGGAAQLLEIISARDVAISQSSQSAPPHRYRHRSTDLLRGSAAGQASAPRRDSCVTTFLCHAPH
jgi:integrase/recombinase XerD